MMMRSFATKPAVSAKAGGDSAPMAAPVRRRARAAILFLIATPSIAGVQYALWSRAGSSFRQPLSLLHHLERGPVDVLLDEGLAERHAELQVVQPADLRA